MKKLNALSIAILLAVLFLFSGTTQLLAQNNCNYERPHRADQWVFGKNASVDFLTDPPTTNYVSALQELPWGLATISDVNGNLLFYSDGQFVYSGSYYNIVNGDGLLGYPASKPPALFVPMPGNANKYFLFTVDIYIPGFRENGVNFSIVERGNGPSSVIVKNKLLLAENAQKICGVQHANGRDYWVLTHGLGSNKGKKLFAYLVTDTISKTVVSTDPFDHTLDPPKYFNGVGGMKFSPDGSKLALVSYGLGLVELFDFNNETGSLTFKSASALGQFPFANSIEFSHDNSKLYITASMIATANEGSRLIQFDLSLANPFAAGNEYELQNFPATSDSIMGGLQLAVDGKIYVSKLNKSANDGKEYLGVIYNPDRPKAASNYNSLNHSANNGLFLNGGQGLLGLPAFVSTFLDIPHFTYIDQCHHDTTLFSITNTANIDKAVWDFNNPDGEAFLTDPLHPGYVFTDPGDYQVDLTETFSGIDYNFSREVRIHSLPFVDLGQGLDTIYILPNSSVRLDAGDYDFYEWYPGGETTRYLDVTESGLYGVMVTDSNCCRNADEVYVLFADLVFPNAFNPNSNITTNMAFRPLGTTSTLAAYKLLIYNRWGQLVFESDDPAEGWDGTYNGEEVPMGTYVYTAIFTSFESGVQAAQEFKKSGSVTLVR